MWNLYVDYNRLKPKGLGGVILGLYEKIVVDFFCSHNI